MDANASYSQKIKNPQNRVIRRKRSHRNMDQLRARFNSRAAGIWLPTNNEQGPDVGTRSPTLNDQLPPPPPPAVQYSQILSRMYGIVPAHQICPGMQSGSNAAPNVVDAITRNSPQRNDWDRNLRTTSEPDLQVSASVPKQENSLGIGLGTSSFLKGQNIRDSQINSLDDSNNQLIFGSSQTASSPNPDNPSTDLHSSCEKNENDNNVKNKDEEGEDKGTRNDPVPTPMTMNEGIHQFDLEVEEYCCFPDIAQYYLDYEYEEWIKWPDDEEQFRSLYR